MREVRREGGIINPTIMPKGCVVTIPHLDCNCPLLGQAAEEWISMVFLYCRERRIQPMAFKPSLRKMELQVSSLLQSPAREL